MSGDQVYSNGGWCFEQYMRKDVRDCGKLFQNIAFLVMGSLEQVQLVNKQIWSRSIRDLISQCGGMFQKNGRSSRLN
jgi:hypothetical protein